MTAQNRQTPAQNFDNEIAIVCLCEVTPWWIHFRCQKKQFTLLFPIKLSSVFGWNWEQVSREVFRKNGKPCLWLDAEV